MNCYQIVFSRGWETSSVPLYDLNVLKTYIRREKGQFQVSRGSRHILFPVFRHSFYNHPSFIKIRIIPVIGFTTVLCAYSFGNNGR